MESTFRQHFHANCLYSFRLFLLLPSIRFIGIDEAARLICPDTTPIPLEINLVFGQEKAWPLKKKMAYSISKNL